MSKNSPLAKRALGFNHCVGPNSSQVTSGRRMFVELGDGRSAWAKRWADLIRLHVSDIGGIGRISEAQLSICRSSNALNRGASETNHISRPRIQCSPAPA